MVLLPARAAAWLGAFALVACSGARPPPAPVPAPGASAARAGKDADAEPVLVTPARVLPPSERAEIAAEAFEPDGSRRFISQGLRMVERPDGSLEVAAEFFPPARAFTATALPQRLGGGYLFVANTGGSALLFAAESFTAPLTPLARFDGEVDRLVAGFDRVYVLRARAAAWLAIDPRTGGEVGLGSLPPAPGYGSIAFADEWLGAIELPYLGVAATFDAGGTWHRLGLDRATLSAADGGVLVEVGGRRQLLGPSGTLDPVAEPEVSRTVGLKRRGPLPAAARRPLGPRPLETAVLHGFPERNGTALVASGGSLVRVRLADGSFIAEARDAYPGITPCDPIVVGTGPGFVCGEPGGPTRLFAFEAPLGLRQVRVFGEPRRVAANGRGALVVRGGCADGTQHEPLYCVLPVGEEPYLVARGSDTERVVALADGRTAVVEPPRTGFPGTLTFAGRGTRGPVVRLSFEKPKDEALHALLEQGFWLDALEQAESGQLRSFITGASSFVGVRVDLSGKLVLGEPEQPLDRAFLSGRYGLAVGRGGGARETTDGGMSWADVDLSAEPDLKSERSFGGYNGCTAVGCAFAGWLRIGWRATERVKRAAAPEMTRFQSPGGGRWSLECESDGRRSGNALPLRPENDERTVSPWNPFGEVPPPVRAATDTGFDVGSEAELYLYRAYVWGPPGDGWARQARWLVRVRDPYRVDGGVWSTAPSPVPWSRPDQAADVFGRSTAGPPSTFRLFADPVRHAALLVVTLRNAVDLFLLEEGRAIVRLETSGTPGVVTGFAMAGSRIYVGALGENRAFRLYSVEASGLNLLVELPDVTARAEPPALAPSLHGDGLALWVHSVHHYLYPFDPSRATLDRPIVVRADALSRMPEPCSSGEDGYMVGDALSLEPGLELGSDLAHAANGGEARLVVSASRVCTDGLAAPAAQVVDGTAGEIPERARAALRGRTANGTSQSGARGNARPEENPTRRQGNPTRGNTPESSPRAARDSARPEGQTSPLTLNYPDGRRRGFRCRD